MAQGSSWVDSRLANRRLSRLCDRLVGGPRVRIHLPPAKRVCESSALSWRCSGPIFRSDQHWALCLAVVEPIGRALMTAGIDQTFHIGFNQDLQYRLRHGSQEIALATLLQQLDKRHSVIGHRVLGGLSVGLAIPP